MSLTKKKKLTVIPSHSFHISIYWDGSAPIILWTWKRLYSDKEGKKRRP